MPKPKKKKPSLKKEFLYLCSCCAAVIVLLVAGLNLQSYLALAPNKVLGTETEDAPRELNEEKAFWENFLKENPDYLDGWIELTKIYDQEGNVSAKENALEKAREINPNSEKLQITK